MKKLQCTNCTQVFWSEIRPIDEKLIGSGEWIESECPKCGEEWVIVEPLAERKRRVIRKKRGRPIKKGIKEAEQKAVPAEMKSDRFSPDQIRNLRQRLGISQREMAVLTGVSLGAVGLWEKGKFKPRGDKKAALMDLQEKGKAQVKEMLARKAGKAESPKSPGGRVKQAREKRPIKKKMKKE